jgi:hypothetical protein
MRHVSLSDGKPLRLSTENRVRLKEWLIQEHRKALDARAQLEHVWRTALRMYAGTPEDKRWLPFEGAPCLEITVGALSADSVYAQAIDLIFQVSPPVTVRPRKGFDDYQEAVQDYLNHGINSTFNFKAAVKEALLDDVQLGTMVFYVPWMQTIRKTDLFHVEQQGPKMYCLDPKDFIIPPRAGKNIQEVKFCTMRKWMDKNEIKLAGRLQGWEIDDPNAASDSADQVGSERLRVAGISPSGGGDNNNSKSQAIGYTWCYFDVDQDGIAEDLEIIWNMTTGGILKAKFNRYDCRPFLLECFQDRAHVAYGVGVMEMQAPFEMAISEIWNNYIWNLMISNTKMYGAPGELLNESTDIYPGKVWDTSAGEVKGIDMGTVTAAPVQAVSLLMSFAEKRVGSQDFSAPGRLGGRTPGITALSALQQANRRFTPAFQNIRDGVGGAVIQCLYRLQEVIRKGEDDQQAKAAIEDLRANLGDDKANKLIELLMKPNALTDAMDIELTASSVSVNREADRQNMMLLAQIYEKYMQGMAMMAQAKAQPQFPGMAELADKASKALTMFMRKILKTFDQVSDVEGYLLDLGDVQPMINPLMQQMNQLAGQMQPGTEQQNGGTPPGMPMQ